MKVFLRCCLILCLILSLCVRAELATSVSTDPSVGGSPVVAEPPVGIGQVADNMLEPVSVLSDFISTACLVLGLAFLFTTLIKYIEHRRSPLMVPISTVIFLLILSLALLALPLSSKVVENGLTYPHSPIPPKVGS